MITKTNATIENQKNKPAKIFRPPLTADCCQVVNIHFGEPKLLTQILNDQQRQRQKREVGILAKRGKASGKSKKPPRRIPTVERKQKLQRRSKLHLFTIRHRRLPTFSRRHPTPMPPIVVIESSQVLHRWIKQSPQRLRTHMPIRK